MELSWEEMRALLQGALYADQRDGALAPRRFTERQQALYDTLGEFGAKARATSGVRLSFRTDAAWCAFSYRAWAATSRRYCFFDIAVDGVLVERAGRNGLSEDRGEARVALPEGTHEVTIYLPAHFETWIERLSLSDGASFAPARRSRRMLAYGDSITQGYDARMPSQSYVNLTADLLDAEPFNQAIGGEVFRPDVIDPALGFSPDFITVAYGTNDWGVRTREDMTRNAAEFYRRLRAGFPGVPIFAITPIWRADDDGRTRVGRFSDAVEIVRNAAAAQSGVVVVDGGRLTPHLSEAYADLRLHPNDFGFRFYAEAFSRVIAARLRDVPERG